MATPALVTVATDGLLLIHVPPVVGDKVMLLPTHTDDPALTVGNELTVSADVVEVLVAQELVTATV